MQRNDGSDANPLKWMVNDSIEINGVESGNVKSNINISYAPVSILGGNNRSSDSNGRNDESPIIGELIMTIDSNNAPENIQIVNTQFGRVRIVCPEDLNGNVRDAFINTRTTPGTYLTNMAINYSALKKSGRKEELLNFLHTILPTVKDVEILLDDLGQSYLSIDIGEKQLPVQHLGEGVERLCRFFLGCARASGGALVIDEIDIGLHHSILEKFWGNLMSWATTNNIQIIATTHSAEFIRAALHSSICRDQAKSLAVHRLYLENDGENNSDNNAVAVKTYSGERLQNADDVNWDLR